MVSLIFPSGLNARASQPGERQKCHQIIRSSAWCQKSVEEGEDIFLSSLPAPLPCQGFWSWPQGRACIISPGSKFQDICHSEGRWQLLGEVLRVENVGLPAQSEAWPSHQKRRELRKDPQGSQGTYTSEAPGKPTDQHHPLTLPAMGISWVPATSPSSNLHIY